MIEINKSHMFHQCLELSSVSPYFQELLVYMGQHSCYEQGCEVIEKLLRVEVNAMQLQRLTTMYGERVTALLEETTAALPVDRQQVIYAEIDGGMLLTREQGWQEVKLGRVFSSQACYQQSDGQAGIRASEYTAHLGTHQHFEEKMSMLTDKYEYLEERLIFITDGATWIGNWINAAYPRASQILDFYHAKEHLGQFAITYFSNQQQASRWIEQHAEQLLEEGLEALIANITALPTRSEAVEKQRKSLLNYYRNNAYRMNYPAYLAKGWCIGSGAIEAAHRTVSQQRLKLSGQRWTQHGAQCVLNLRVLRMSNRWHELQQLIKCAA